MSIILILGSAAQVVSARDWPRAPFDTIVAINNAWAVRPDWDFHIHPEDFPPERCPIDTRPPQQTITASDYVPAQNAYGGFIYGGGTMAFTASYWALHALRPSVIAYLGCDMIYPEGAQTHFYGTGTADPLRTDISLRSLSAKSARFAAIAARNGCAVANLSGDPSRLTFPRATLQDVDKARPLQLDQPAVEAALAAEAALGYMVPSGRYWEVENQFDPTEIDRIDALWLATLQ
ncbi:hypothetical protein [Octadecabacter sp. R77987]|uniref:hypothetical protein n=1 Tax=Octadecabacter sp. R77987 TaxID=3093874 RepID=UPI0036713AB1